MQFLKFSARAALVQAAVALAAAVSVSSAAQAAEATGSARLDESVRCFAVTSMLMTMDDPETKNVGQMGGLYFMGRLDGALSDKDLEDRLFAFSQDLPNQDLQKLLAHCGDIMKVRGTAMQDIGSRVGVREEAAAAAKKK